LSFRNFAFSGRLTGGNRLFNVLTLTGTAAPNYGPWKLATKAELDRIGLVRRWATWAWVDPEQGAHVTALCSAVLRFAGNWENKPFCNFTTRQSFEDL